MNTRYSAGWISDGGAMSIQWNVQTEILFVECEVMRREERECLV